MTRIQFRVLYREFLLRMVDLEVLSAHAEGDASKLLGQVAALLVISSLLFSIPALGFGKNLTGQALLVASWSIEHFLVATTMLVVGLFAVLSQDSTFPTLRDVMVLGPLPVRPRTMFLAKVTAVATALGAAVLVLHAIAGFVWPLTLNAESPALVVPAFSSDPARPPVDAVSLQAVLDRDLAPLLRAGPLASGGGAGVAIGISRRGVRRIFTYGAAKPDSLFEIGSITKTFTGLVLARMAEEGRVRLDEPVREVLPPGTVAKPAGEEITLLDLATQHSGLPRAPGHPQPAGETNPDNRYQVADLYAFMGKHGVGKPENTGFLYSNLGFGLLGQALAERAEMSYTDLVREEITGRLGMNDTVFRLLPEQRKRFLQGHSGDHHPVPASEVNALAGSGALRSTAGDMLAYLEANLHPERLPPGSLARALHASHELRATLGSRTHIALAWLHDDRTGTYEHGGATPGYTGDAFFNPREDFAGIVLSNTGPGTIFSADYFGEHIRARLAGRPAAAFEQMQIPPGGSFVAWLRQVAAYWITMLAASGFIYCCVLGVQGLAAQLPRLWFLRVSSFIQLGLFALFVGVYLFQPMLALPGTILAAQQTGPLSWSPTFWFLGLFQQLAGSPAMAMLAHRATIGSAIALLVTATAYLLSYFRTLRKVVEQPDIVAGSRGPSWLGVPGHSVPAAIVRFSIRTLLRSRRHRLILAFYWGIAFGVGVFFLKTPLAEKLSAASGGDPWHHADTPVLAATVLVMGFCVFGARAAFAMPLDLPANWIFQVTPGCWGAQLLGARRLSLLLISVVPIWLGCAAALVPIWPWRQAAGHLAVLAVIGFALAEFSLQGTQKIPFTCSYLPGRSHLHITFWLMIGLVQVAAAKAADFERRALMDGRSYPLMLAGLGLVAAFAWWRSAAAAGSEEARAQFEEDAPDRVLTLDLR